MADPPKRRWFRFKLSTALILTAIVAWGMATRPYWITHRTSWTVPIRYNVGPEFKLTRDHKIKSKPSVDNYWHGYKVEFVHADGATAYYSGSRRSLNYRLAGPALALAAFLAWKAAWAVVERRRRNSATRLGAHRISRARGGSA